MKPAQVPAAREIVRAFRADDVQVVIEPRAIGVKLAGQVYGVCAETIRRLQDEQGFPCVRIGTRRLVPVGDIQLEEVRDQRIRREMRHRCSVSCVLPAGHEGLHMRQDGTRISEALLQSSATVTAVAPAPMALRDTLPPSAAVASRQADELAAADDSTFAQAFHAEMARTS